jgi:ATP-binding cassette, subfamily C, bacterial
VPMFLQMFVDQVLINRQAEWLQPLILGMLFTACLTGLLTRLQLQILRRLKMQLSMRMSSRFVWHLLHLPVGFYDQRSAGEISSRIQFNDRLANLLSGQLATTTIACVMLVFYAAVMLQYDRLLTLMTISIVVVNLLISRWVSRRRRDLNTRITGEQGKVSAIAISGLQSIETIKASGLESDFFTRWAGYYAKAINAQQEMESLSQQMGLLPSFLSALSSMLLLVVGGWRVMDQILTIGQLIAFQSLVQQFMQPVSQVFQLGNDVQELEGTMNRLDDVLSNPTDALLDHHLDHATAPPIDALIDSMASSKLQGHLELRNLTFGYNRTAPPLIANFSLSLKPGQRVALVGGSGSGKSTIAKVVAGLYEPWSGDILLDGQLRHQIPRPVLVNSVAMVQQDILLFSGTVRDNLTLWDTTLSERRLVQACRDAAIHDVITALPGGYGANLLEGASNLSGGQRQRLEIARSLVIDPAILIMDEATSALDSETEKLIDYSLRLRGCTCLIVAHRLSTIRDCDEIIVLDRGTVVQRGTHDQLRQMEGHYLELMKSEGTTLEEDA